MIYEPIITKEGFKRFNNIPSAYYCCSWVEGEDVIRGITSIDGFIAPPNYPNGPAVLDGLATRVSDGYEYFLEQIEEKGKTIPESLK